MKTSVIVAILGFLAIIIGLTTIGVSFHQRDMEYRYKFKEWCREKGGYYIRGLESDGPDCEFTIK